ncbi:hypothetical protein CC86DRAFT_411932 [Ophiobolus disseminans]|uniref:F-box domain-containing protein n=1 Tax=Ophiobolus disseminans TaxID=1469910 RepID=A0A6A6ZIC6_9PLEO|nr:hypothetical protein CC86DRAFT_411932 [Ophiobolus disseminans]
MGAALSRLPPNVKRRAGCMSSKMLRRAAPSASPLVAHAPFVVEILEAVLLEVDQRTLLVACLRVSKTWNTVISGSLALQQCLYFSPARGLDPKDHECYLDCPCPVNPLLHWGFPGWSHVRGPDSEEDGICKEPHIDIREQFRALPWTKNANAWRRKEASWRRMEVTQPPTRRLQVDKMIAFMDARLEFDNSDALVTFPHDRSKGAGLLMGALYDYIVKTALAQGAADPTVQAEDEEFSTVHIHFLGRNCTSTEEEFMTLRFQDHLLTDFRSLVPLYESEASENTLRPEMKYRYHWHWHSH